MRVSSIMALAVGLSGVRAAVVPPCNACKQDECMDSIIKEECGDYLVIVHTPATTTILETITATVVPTEISHVSARTTFLRNITTTIDVLASHTIDYTVTLVESETATETETLTETLTVTESPIFTVYRREDDDDDGDEDEYELPEYASMCTDIYQYSSACDCIGFVPSTSTAPAPSTTKTLTETVTPSTAVITSTIATLSYTRNVTTIPVTTTVSTVSISRAVDTITQTTVVATLTVTDTTTTTFTQTTTQAPPPRPTITGFIQAEGGILAEDVNIPPGAHIGVILTMRQTTIPATWIFKPDGTISLAKTVSTSSGNTYGLYMYNSVAGYSYVQVTSELVAGIMGVTPLLCDIMLGNELWCRDRDGRSLDIYACGRHAAVVLTGYSASFQGTCATPIIKLTPRVVPPFN